MLGDGPALTMAQKFYQRALSGDSAEIIAGAREFLKRRPLAAYCDTVLMPALQLGRADLATGEITTRQQAELRGAVVRVVEALDGSNRGQMFHRQRGNTVLDETSPGRLLRQQRVQRQRGEAARAASPTGMVPAAPGSLVLCVGLGSLGDDLATELLVRILRGARLDARHLGVEDLHAPRPAEVTLAAIGAVCIVSAAPGPEREQGAVLARELREKLPHAHLLAMLLPSVLAQADPSTLGDTVDRVSSSFEDAALEVTERIGPAGVR